MGVGIMASSVTSTAWSPLDLGSALWGWWDPSNVASISTVPVNKVTQLNDLSGNARHLTQTTSARRPTSGAAIGGLNALTFSANALGVANGATQTLAQPLTLVAVADVDIVNSTLRYVWGSGPSVVTNSSTWRMSVAVDVNTGVALDGNVHLHVVIFNGASSIYRLDGVQIGAGDPGSGGLSGAAVYGAFSYAAGSAFAGKLGEALWTSTVMAGADLTNLETYLKTKWGIP